MGLVGVTGAEVVEPAEDLGMAAQQAGDEHHEQGDDHRLQHDEGGHGTFPQTTGIPEAAPNENC